MNFFKSFLASILGTFVALLIIGIVFFIGIASLATAVGAEESVEVKVSKNSLLKLDLDLPISENIPVTQEFEQVLGITPELFKFTNVLQAIHNAADNENIKGIYLKSQFPSMGWSQAESLRSALGKFKEKGKFIYSYGDYYSQKGYYLASVADSIFLNPLGRMEIKGLAAEVLYYKDFQEEYGFKMEVVRHGKYKSAVEPYLESEMSTSNRTQLTELLGSIWETIGVDVTESRKIDSANLDQIANQLNASIAHKALKEGVIDGTIDQHAFELKLKNALGIAKDEKIKKTKLSQLTKTSALYKKGVRERIAVIYAQGPILYGEGSENIIGQEVFVEAIEDAVKNRRVKAIVLRIDSPGGSALSSEIIWKALMEAKKEKPLVVSMGDVAASGGYYLATAGDEIYANKLTITGSIGAFATFPNAKGFVESIGINPQHVLTHKNALGFSLFEAPSSDFRASIREGIEHTYATFKTRVADSRKLSLEEVEAIAQGRVWTGSQALEKGLVDGLGGFPQALEAAARLAELEDYNLISYPKIEPEFDDFLKIGGPLGAVEERLLNKMPKAIQSFLTTLEYSPEKASIELRLPYVLEIE